MCRTIRGLRSNSILEGSSGIVTVSLSSPLAADLNASITVYPASTTPSSDPVESDDYRIPSLIDTIPSGSQVFSLTLTIPGGSEEFTFTLDAIDDLVYENDEGLVLELSADTRNVHLGATQRLVTILRTTVPEPTLRYDDIAGSVREGEGFTFTVEVLGSSEIPLTLSLEPGDGSTVEGDDLTLTPREIAIDQVGRVSAPITQFEFNLRTTPDDIYEGYELIALEITLRDDAGSQIGQTGRFVTIIDDELRPTLSLDPIEDVKEGADVNVTVRLSGALETPLTVSLMTGAASTVETDDYTISPISYIIQPGEFSAQFQVEVFDDPLYELTETLVFSITASNTEAGIELPMLSRSIEIAESEALPPRIVLLAIDDPITEGGDGVTVTVRVNGAFEVPLTLSLTTAVTSVAGRTIIRCRQTIS